MASRKTPPKAPTSYRDPQGFLFIKDLFPEPAATSASKPAAKPASKPASKPAAKPAAKPATKPATKTASKPAAKPAASANPGKRATAAPPAAKAPVARAAVRDVSKAMPTPYPVNFDEVPGFITPEQKAVAEALHSFRSANPERYDRLKQSMKESEIADDLRARTTSQHEKGAIRNAQKGSYKEQWEKRRAVDAELDAIYKRAKGVGRGELYKIMRMFSRKSALTQNNRGGYDSGGGYYG